MYSALMVFKHMKDVHDIAYDVAGDLLRDVGAYEDWIKDYPSELMTFSLFCKQDMLVTDRADSGVFYYDFIALEEYGFNSAPRDYARPEGVSHFAHDDPQRELVAGYRTVYGDSNRGLGNIFGMGKNVRNFYRRIKEAPSPQPPMPSALSESP